MSNHAEEFIKQKYEDLDQQSDENYASITIRLPPKDALMLKAIAKGLNFPVSTAFTKILSMDLYDMVMSLNDEDFSAFLKKHYRYYEGRQPYWLKQMIEEGLIEEPELPSFEFVFNDPLK